MSAAGKRRLSIRVVQWLLLVTAILLAIVLVRLAPRRAEPASKDQWQPPLRPGEAAAVTVIELARDPNPLRLARENGRWRITEPVVDLGSARMVGELFRALETLEIVRHIDSDSLSRYGLDPPWAVLTLQLRDGRKISMRVGDTAPASGDTYATWDGLTGIALVPRFIIARFFESDLMSWRETEMLPAASAAIDSVTVLWPTEKARLARLGQDEWRMIWPPGRDADGVACERAVAAFWRFQFTRFFDDPLTWPELGLDHPAATWIVYRGGQIDTLVIGRLLEAGSMAVRDNHRPPAAAPATVRDLLTGGVGALELRAFVRGRAEDVTAVLACSDGSATVLFRSGATWRAGKPSSEAIARAEAGSFPDTTSLAAVGPAGAQFDSDLHNLFALRGDAWLAPASSDTRAEDFPLRIYVWTSDGARQWAFFRPEAGAGERGPMRETGVSSRYPRRPMLVTSATLDRWRIRANRGAEPAALGH